MLVKTSVKCRKKLLDHAKHSATDALEIILKTKTTI